MFPEQIRGGLRPWQPLKLYMGGVRENEDWTLRIDTGEYSPWLGDSYQNFARIGLSFQRSQNGGRFSRAAGTVRTRTTSGWQSSVDRAGEGNESSSTASTPRIPGLFRRCGGRRRRRRGAARRPSTAEVEAAVSAFSMENPSAVVPALARGLGGDRGRHRAVRQRTGCGVHAAR